MATCVGAIAGRDVRMALKNQEKPDLPLTPRHAWQPFTPRGVAAFSTATVTRLFLVQLVIAALVAFSFVVFLRAAWFPVIEQGIQALPATGQIRGGELTFPAPSPVKLAENARLGLVVDTNGVGLAGQVADLQLSLERYQFALCGALGCWWRPYPPGYIVTLNRTELIPAWGAWRGAVQWLSALGIAVLMLFLWWGLALVYTPALKFVAFFADRDLSWLGAWRVAAAALLPGGGLMAAAITLYGLGVVDLLRFTLLYALHLVAGWIFIGTSVPFLPRLPTSRPGGNPFGVSRAGSPANPNPFSGSGQGKPRE